MKNLKTSHVITNAIIAAIIEITKAVEPDIFDVMTIIVCEVLEIASGL